MERQGPSRGESAPRTDLVLGLDEAGRGSVLGPLVVGGFLTEDANGRALRDLGVRDSKLLSPARRTELFRELPRLGRCVSLCLSPALIDAAVRDQGLNLLEARAFARLTRQTGAPRVFVDACDPVAERFGRTVARLAGLSPHQVDARHKADRDLPIVGAGSIVAKVIRDRAIARLARRLGAPIGSGYPGDAVTRQFLTETLQRNSTPPPFVRASWKTTETLMPPSPARSLESFAP